MTKQKKDKPASVKKTLLVIFTLLLLLCCLPMFLLWYLPFDPKSPPPTELGSAPEFDALFENDKWSYLFVVGDQIIQADIKGDDERIAVDIVGATQNTNSKLLYDFAISPDRKYIIVEYFNERDTRYQYKPPMVNPPLEKNLIINILSGDTIDLPNELDGYEYSWSDGEAYWLSPDVFLISMSKDLGDGYSSRREVFVRYDLEDMANPHILGFKQCRSIRVFDYEEGVLLLIDECGPGDQDVRAIDIDGIRLANPQESDIYKMCNYSSWRENENCPQYPPIAPGTTLETEYVVGEGYDDMLDTFSRWYSDNKGRFFIYLNGTLARITDTGGTHPFWDSDMEMFIWQEWDRVYQMDIDRHYRFWHEGDYLGKIPKN